MSRIVILMTLILSASLLICSCSKDAQLTDTSGTVGATDGAVQSEPTEPQDVTDVVDPDGYDGFIEENFGDHGENGEYDYKDEVGGKPVTEFGNVGEDGEQHYTPDDPDAPDVYRPDTTEPTQPDGDPTEPSDSEPTQPDGEDPTEPTDSEPTQPDDDPTEPSDSEPTQPDGDPTEPTEPPSEPEVVPKNLYAIAVSNIDDYTADIQYKCEVELTDGSVTKYVYKYRVSKQGDIYSAAYMEKGQEKIATFDSTVGIMTVDGKEKYCTLADFYRFCSMVEPLPLKVYFYEHSEAGTDFSAKMNAEDHRAMLLNTSPLFTGFDKMDGVNMGKLYFNGHVNSDGVYTGSELAFDMDYTEKSLGEMLFRVSVEVDYVV